VAGALTPSSSAEPTAQRPLVHIGYHKTGSTWLQMHLFRSSEVHFALGASRRNLYEWIVAPGPFDYEPAAARARLAGSLARVAPEYVPVLSHERLSGFPFSGGFDSARIARRVRDALDDASVLIVVREQQAMIRSLYRQYVKEGGALSLDGFMVATNPSLPSFSLDFLRYHELIAYYVTLFGPDRVLVLPFELFVADGREFVRRILEWCNPRGLEQLPHLDLPYTKAANPSPAAGVIAGRAAVNFLFGTRRSINPHSLLPQPVWRVDKVNRLAAAGLSLLPQAVNRALDRRARRLIAARTAGMFGASNSRTSELAKMDLAAYGYECG
jgi:hypothetical protein